MNTKSSDFVVLQWLAISLKEEMDEIHDTWQSSIDHGNLGSQAERYHAIGNVMTMARLTLFAELAYLLERICTHMHEGKLSMDFAPNVLYASKFLYAKLNRFALTGKEQMLLTNLRIRYMQEILQTVEGGHGGLSELVKEERFSQKITVADHSTISLSADDKKKLILAWRHATQKLLSANQNVSENLEMLAKVAYYAMLSSQTHLAKCVWQCANFWLASLALNTHPVPKQYAHLLSELDKVVSQGSDGTLETVVWLENLLIDLYIQIDSLKVSTEETHQFLSSLDYSLTSEELFFPHILGMLEGMLFSLSRGEVTVHVLEEVKEQLGGRGWTFYESYAGQIISDINASKDSPEALAQMQWQINTQLQDLYTAISNTYEAIQGKIGTADTNGETQEESAQLRRVRVLIEEVKHSFDDYLHSKDASALAGSATFSELDAIFADLGMPEVAKVIGKQNQLFATLQLTTPEHLSFSFAHSTAESLSLLEVFLDGLTKEVFDNALLVRAKESADKAHQLIANIDASEKQYEKVEPQGTGVRYADSGEIKPISTLASQGLAEDFREVEDAARLFVGKMPQVADEDDIALDDDITAQDDFVSTADEDDIALDDDITAQDDFVSTADEDDIALDDDITAQDDFVSTADEDDIALDDDITAQDDFVSTADEDDIALDDDITAQDDFVSTADEDDIALDDDITAQDDFVSTADEDDIALDDDITAQDDFVSTADEDDIALDDDITAQDDFVSTADEDDIALDDDITAQDDFVSTADEDDIALDDDITAQDDFVSTADEDDIALDDDITAQDDFVSTADEDDIALDDDITAQDDFVSTADEDDIALDDDITAQDDFVSTADEDDIALDDDITAQDDFVSTADEDDIALDDDITAQDDFVSTADEDDIALDDDITAQDDFVSTADEDDIALDDDITAQDDFVSTADEDDIALDDDITAQDDFVSTADEDDIALDDIEAENNNAQVTDDKLVVVDPVSVKSTPVTKTAVAPSEAYLEAQSALKPDDFEFDEDIREIFVEEAVEVLETLVELLPSWQANPTNLVPLKDIRRGFHTLKGSGRMVGAFSVGEMAWAVENMLNRVLDGTIPSSHEVSDFVADTASLIPALVQDFASKVPPSIDPANVVLKANNILAGRAVDEGVFYGDAQEELATDIVDDEDTLIAEEDDLNALISEEDDDTLIAEEDDLNALISEEDDDTLIAEEDDLNALISEEDDDTLIAEEDDLNALISEEDDDTLIAEEDDLNALISEEDDDTLIAEEDDLNALISEEDDDTLIAEEDDLNALISEEDDDTLIAEEDDLNALISEEDDDAKVEEIKEEVSTALDVSSTATSIAKTATALVAMPAVLLPFIETAKQPVASQVDAPDDDIKEIFIEEASEVLETIIPLFDEWTGTRNKSTLTDVRRGFHTLKGSGRMVGAVELGELAWSIENMLNRVLDSTVNIDDGMIALIKDVLDEFGALVGIFEQNGTDYPEKMTLWIASAHAYSKGHGEEFDYRELAKDGISDTVSQDVLEEDEDTLIAEEDDLNALISEEDEDTLIAEEDDLNALISEEDEDTLIAEEDDLNALISEEDEDTLIAEEDDLNALISEEDEDTLIAEEDDLNALISEEDDDTLIAEEDDLNALISEEDEDTLIAEEDDLNALISEEDDDTLIAEEDDLNALISEEDDDAKVEEIKEEVSTALDVSSTATSIAKTATALVAMPAVLLPFIETAKQPVASQVDAPDDDIKEIFIEEASEVLETIIPLFDEWTGTRNKSTLTDVRRGFHTLKGSGRMVGAVELGELAWSIENMLNRVLDSTVNIDDGMIALIKDVLDEFGALVGIFEQNGTDYPEKMTLWIASAHAYSKGHGEEFDYRKLGVSDEASASAVKVDESTDEVEDEKDAQVSLEVLQEVTEALSHITLPAPVSNEEEMLCNVFVDEAKELIQKVKIFSQNNTGKDNVPVNDDVVRVFHTLRGASGLSPLAPIGELGAKIEAGLQSLQRHDKPMTKKHLQALDSAVEIIEQHLGTYERIRNNEVVVAESTSEADELLDELLGQDANLDNPFEVSELIDGIDTLLDAELDLEGVSSQSSEEISAYANAIVKDIEVLEGRTATLPKFQRLLLTLSASYQLLAKHPEQGKNDEFIDALLRVQGQLTGLFDSLAGSMSLKLDDKSLALLDSKVGDIQEYYRSIDNRSLVLEAEKEDEVKAVETVKFQAVEADPDLLGIFLEEASELDTAIGDSFGEWKANTSNIDALKALQRHLHTVKGGARLAGITSVGDLTHEAETIYERMVDGRLAPSDGWVRIMQGVQDLLSLQLEELKQNNRSFFADGAVAKLQHFLEAGEVPEGEFIAMPVLDNANTQESPTPQEQSTTAPKEEISDFEHHKLRSWQGNLPDADILNVFLEEAEELVESSSEDFQTFRSNTGDVATLQVLQRKLHTIKGGARMVTATGLADLAHNMETVYEDLANRRRPATRMVIQLLMACHDFMAGAIVLLKSMLNPPTPTPLITALDNFSKKPDSLTEVPLVSLAEELEAIANYESQEKQRQGGRDISRMPPSMGMFELAEENTASNEMIRISAPLMERMINLSGEAAINRARIDMTISGLTSSVEEMGVTVQRLHDQLRRMDIELEAQIMAQIDDKTLFEDGDFDPLEMDQYSSLNQLSKSLSESASDLLDLKATLLEKTRDGENLLLQLSRTQTELQDGLMYSRMVPFSRLTPRLQRIVRQVSTELGKSVELNVVNADDEMDRTILERITSPLEHMLRNAIDHGVEMPDEREALGKPRTGTIILEVVREGSEILVHLKDDGAGINVDAVRKKAISQGLIDANDTSLSDLDIMQYIFNAGLSTTSVVTQISGRGVGMDVVRSEIRQLGGSVAVDSERGKGSKFTMRIPLTVAVSDTLVVRAADRQYAVPLVQIERITQVPTEDLMAYYRSNNATITIGGLDYRLRYLNEILSGHNLGDLAASHQTLPVILIKNQAGQNFALQVDEIVGSRIEVVVKPLGRQLAHVSGISAATIMGDGSVMFILDLMALIRNAKARVAVTVEEVVKEKKRPVILVVDDSVTVRKVTSRFLERQGFEAVVAKDGVDALEILQELNPDLMLLDIEMPRMDGFEVATQVRHNPRLKDLPIIMITSRTGEKHRERAFSIGVTDYMGKPFQENELLSRINTHIS